MNKLKSIINYKQQELQHKCRQVTKKDYEIMQRDAEAPLPFLQNFKQDQINIIAEVKKASPSAGVIINDFNPLKISQIYQDNGAKAISVLTDEHFFQGHLDYLKQIKSKIKLPVLRKDFTLSEYHILEGRAYGADAILLIVAVLDDYQIRDYNDLIIELGMTPLIEIHDKTELNRALKLNLSLLGINNRNLKTFEVDSNTSIELIRNSPKDLPVISESGIDSHDTILKLKKAGISGFLIGETLIRAKNIGETLKKLIGSCHLETQCL